MLKLSRQVVPLLGLLLLQTTLVLGQAPGTGAIAGLVMDPAGHPVPNVSVTIENEATAVSR